ncbi:hypothetical protein FH972_005719 [Carpinus fangiana]|uniref:Uncharacterized protein n=1 Tax=Carpinus fangiana TaxID=176857 RepID=A0A5N6QQ39_9ROSI|nr:hypothetical protein FH972_005719 [Carpinus fangiana]
MSEMIKRALEAEREQHRAQITRVSKEITAQVAQQVSEQMSAQMQAYEVKIHRLVEGSRVVTSEPEVTNVMALTRIIYRSFVDSKSADDVNVEPNEDHNEDQAWILVGHKSPLSN